LHCANAVWHNVLINLIRQRKSARRNALVVVINRMPTRTLMAAFALPKLLALTTDPLTRKHSLCLMLRNDRGSRLEAYAPRSVPTAILRSCDARTPRDEAE
jgi:hypothetical protein